MVALASATIRASTALFAAPAYATACWMSGWVRKCAARERARGARRRERLLERGSRGGDGSGVRAEDAHAREPAGVVRVPVRLRLRANRRVVPGEVRDVGEVRGGGAPRGATTRRGARDPGRAPRARRRGRPSRARAPPARSRRRRRRPPRADDRGRSNPRPIRAKPPRRSGPLRVEGGGGRSGREGCSGRVRVRSLRDVGKIERARRERAPRAGAGVARHALRLSRSASLPAPVAMAKRPDRQLPARGVAMGRAERAAEESAGCYTAEKITTERSSERGRAGRTIKQCPKMETGQNTLLKCIREEANGGKEADISVVVFLF